MKKDLLLVCNSSSLEKEAQVSVTLLTFKGITFGSEFVVKKIVLLSVISQHHVCSPISVFDLDEEMFKCNGFTSDVYDAANVGNVDLVTSLVSQGHAIDARHPFKLHQTPLYIAALQGKVEVVERLVELGSQALDTPDLHGNTPIYAATFNGHVAVIEALVRFGSKAIDIANNLNVTPIQAAGRMGRLECLQTLLVLGASCPIESTEKWSKTMIKHLGRRMKDDEVLELRYRVYFKQSLTSRLLPALAVHQ